MRLLLERARRCGAAATPRRRPGRHEDDRAAGSEVERPSDGEPDEDDRPIATASRSVPRNERATSCAEATGRTIIAAINRTPTTRIPAMITPAVSAASDAGTHREPAHPRPVLVGDDREQGPPPTDIAITTPIPSATIEDLRARHGEGSPNRNESVSSSTSPARLAKTAPSAIPT